MHHSLCEYNQKSVDGKLVVCVWSWCLELDRGDGWRGAKESVIRMVTLVIVLYREVT